MKGRKRQRTKQWRAYTSIRQSIHRKGGYVIKLSSGRELTSILYGKVVKGSQTSIRQSSERGHVNAVTLKIMNMRIFGPERMRRCWRNGNGVSTSTWWSQVRTPWRSIFSTVPTNHPLSTSHDGSSFHSVPNSTI